MLSPFCESEIREDAVEGGVKSLRYARAKGIKGPMVAGAAVDATAMEEQALYQAVAPELESLSEEQARDVIRICRAVLLAHYRERARGALLRGDSEWRGIGL